MNPNSGTEIQPGFEVPQPSEGQEARHDHAMEQQPAQESAVGKRPPTAPVAPTPLALLATDDTPAGPAQAVKPVPDDVTTADLAAHNVDLIEKQWVERAKAIVDQTRDDPHRQKHEMGKVKADYVKKRFNKTIPTDDPLDAAQGRPEQGRTGDPVKA